MRIMILERVRYETVSCAVKAPLSIICDVRAFGRIMNKILVCDWQNYNP